MTRFLTSKDFGNFSIKEGKLKVYRRAKDKSQQIQWRKSKKQTVISRKAAAKLSRP